jgi:peroxiredoxin
MKLLTLAFAALVLSASLSAADMAATPGLVVGTKAPDFTLKNATGEDVALSALLKKGKVALVFYRSADWCPFCKKQLQDLQKNLPEIAATGVQIVGMSYDAPATSAAAAAKLGLTFPLLSDTGSKVIDAYGIRNAEAKGKSAGVAHPVLFIIDQQGVIRVKLAREGYRERPESAEIIAGVKSIK